MSFFDTISRIIQQGKEMAVKATPSSTVTYNKVTPVDNSKFQSNPLLRDKPLQYQAPVIQQPTFNVPVKAEVPLADTKLAVTTPEKTNQTMAQTVSEIIQGGKESVKLGGGLAKDVFRGTNRAAVAGGTFVGARVLGADVNQANQAQFKPKTGLERFLFGDQPASIQSEGITPLESMGVSPEKATKYGAPFVLGSIALDAFTGGSSKAAKKTLEKVAANMTAEDATLLRNLYARPTAKDVLPIARNEQAIITALKLDKLPYDEQKKAVSNILEAYEKRWGGVDEALNPPVKPNRAGAMDVKKPNQLEEAKKYKSADEFVKAQGEPVYHGTTEKIQGDFRYPLYTTPKKDYAQVFADSTAASSISKSGKKLSDAPMVHEFAVNPKARVLDITNPAHRKLLEEQYFGKYSMSYDPVVGKNGHIDWTEGENLAEWIEETKQPFDAIRLDEGGGGIDPSSGLPVIDKGVSYLALNKNALKSKSQLTDLYSQANKPSIKDKIKGSLKSLHEDTGGGYDGGRSAAERANRALNGEDPLESLKQEARKYKSAEEFVKAQGALVYRGGFDLSEEKLTNAGISVSKGLNVAEDFVKQKGGKVDEMVISQDAKIVNYSDVPNVKFKNLNDYSPELDKGDMQIWRDLEVEYQKAINWAKENGYDGVNLPLEGETRVINPDVLKTRTQLEDIWKQANTKQKPNKMADYRAGKPNSEGGYIQNPLAGKGETPKSNNQVVSSGNDSTRLSPIDRLIADNKIRVVSRNGRDVYQVKKGDTWVNKRDEDSAIRAVTPRSPIDVIKKTKAPKFASDAAEDPRNFKSADAAVQVKNKSPQYLQDKVSPEGYYTEGRYPDSAYAKEFIVKNDIEGTPVKSGDKVAIIYDKSRQMYTALLDKPKIDPDTNLSVRDFYIKPDNFYLSGTKPQPATPKVRQMSRSRDVAWLEREATDRVLREQKRVEKQLSPAFRSVLDEPTPLNKETVAQLEKAAMPTADVVRPSTPYKAESLANVITKTPLDRKVNIIDYLRTPDRVLNKIGFGKEAKLLRDQYEKYSVELPKNIDKISQWVKRAPGKDASTRIFQYLDGKAVKLSPTEKKVADEIRAYLKDWADRLGLPEENRVANYITRLFDDQLIKQEFDEDLAKIISGKIPGEVYNPFLQKRLGAKGYKQDVWGALDAYTKRATRKVHLDPALDRIREKAGSSLDFTQLEESQFKYIQRYIDRVQMRPTEVDNAIDNAVKQTLGYRFGQRPVTTVSRFLRRMTYRGMLGANLGSALRNLSQGVNTYAVLGEKYTAIGYAKLLQPASQRELIEQGIFNNNFIEDRVLSSTKKLLQKGDKALWFFFDRAEKINRGSAYLGAKAKGLGRGMTEQQAIDYAKNIVRKTQFSYDAVDQPVALGSDIMKTMFQFQTYTTKQAEFLTEMVKDKNVVGLLRYAIGGYLFVNTVGKALGMEESELVPLWDTITGERKFSPAPSLKFPIELTKAIADTPDRYGNDRDLEQKTKDVGKSLIGLIPGGTQIKKTYEGYKASQEGGSFDKAGRKQFEVGNSKASQLQAILFGKYANQNAKDYFNKETNTGNKELDETIKDSKEKEKNRSKDAEAMLVSLKSLPPDRANAVMKELKINDEAMFNKVKALKQAEDLNWSKEEKAIANLGVTDGTKARYVYSQVNKLGTAEEKNAYLKELLDRKIISKEVLKQIRDLKEGGKNNDIIE